MSDIGWFCIGVIGFLFIWGLVVGGIVEGLVPHIKAKRAKRNKFGGGEYE